MMVRYTKEDLVSELPVVENISDYIALNVVDATAKTTKSVLVKLEQNGTEKWLPFSQLKRDTYGTIYCTRWLWTQKNQM
jgi:hypothetical protein